MNGELEEERESYLETEVDELYELIKKNGLVKVKAAAKRFKVKRERIEEWGRILEEHDLAVLHYPPFGDPVIILRKFKPKTKVKTRKIKIKNKKAVFVNIVILLVFAFFVLWYTGGLGVPLDLSALSLPDLSNVMDVDAILDILVRNQIYLVLVLIIIIVLLLILTTRRRGKKRGKKGEKHGKERS